MLTFHISYPQAKNEIKKQCLLTSHSPSFFLTDSDLGIEKGLQTGLPVIAWKHSENDAESLMSAPWLILSLDALTPDYIALVTARHNGQPLLIARSKRMLIRELTMGDLPALMELQLELTEHPDGHFFPVTADTPASQQSFLENYINHQYPFFGFGIYGLFDKDILLGIAGYSQTQDPAIGNLSYAVRPAYQGQGYATEALKILFPMGTEEFGFEKVLSYIHKENTASLRLAQKCGIPISIL